MFITIFFTIYSENYKIYKKYRSIFTADVWGGLITVLVGPWMGATLLLFTVFGVAFYFRKARPMRPYCESRPVTQQEFNSYAESYEVSSNLSSAHHMNIQVMTNSIIIHFIVINSFVFREFKL